MGDVTGLVDILNSDVFVAHFKQESSAVVGVKGDLLAPHKPKKKGKRRSSRGQNSQRGSQKRKRSLNSRRGGGQDERKDTQDDEEETNTKLRRDEEKQAAEFGRGRRKKVSTKFLSDFVVGDGSSDDGVSEVDEDELTDGEGTDVDHGEIQLGPGMESVEEGKVEGGDDSHSDGF